MLIKTNVCGFWQNKTPVVGCVFSIQLLGNVMMLTETSLDKAAAVERLRLFYIL